MIGLQPVMVFMPVTAVVSLDYRSEEVALSAATPLFLVNPETQAFGYAKTCIR